MGPETDINDRLCPTLYRRAKCGAQILDRQHVDVLKLRADRGSRSFFISFISRALSSSWTVPKTATRESLGSISFRMSIRLPFNSGESCDKPVTLPPGRARLATIPAADRIVVAHHDDGNR